MKAKVLLFSAICLAPTVCLLGGYLSGWEVVNLFHGLFISLSGCLLVPLVTFVVLLFKVKPPWVRKLGIAAATVAGQILLLSLMPAARTADLMGRAHRLRSEFSTKELKELATGLHKKNRLGVLKQTTKPEGYWAFAANDATWIDLAELPPEMKKRFAGVYLLRDHATGEAQTGFALTEREGIFCGTIGPNHRMFVHPIADGMYAYHLVRD